MPKIHLENIADTLGVCVCVDVLFFQAHFIFSNLFARDFAEHTFDSVGIIPRAKGQNPSKVVSSSLAAMP